MSGSAGGRLAAAVSAAGGLGLIGYGAGDTARAEQERANAGNARVGGGFITWVLAKQPHSLAALAHRPVATMLAFADPAPFAPAIHAAGSPLICMAQNLALARAAIAVGADIIVAQATAAYVRR